MQRRRNVKRKLKGFTLIELLVVIAIIALLISILLPSLSRARELSKRLVCAANIKGIGTSAKIYANDNNERWMIPPYSDSAYSQGGNGIDYLNDDGDAGRHTGATDAGEVAYDRERESTSDVTGQGNSGSTAVSVTRAYWMMVRSGDITVQQFICPSSGDQADDTEDIDLYYDFVTYNSISYGYQVPFGPRDTQPREGADNRMVFAADKGPYYFAGADPTSGFNSGGPNGAPLTINDAPRLWRPFNSGNHGGNNNGEGQNCLYADGHASFQRTPIVGIDSDNIYTLMVDDWEQLAHGRIFGDSPHISAAKNPYPGQNALGNDAQSYSSTDSLIYP